MQWSSGGLGGERELEEGKQCFFWEGREEEGCGEGGGMETQVLGKAYFHPAFILLYRLPFCHPPPPPPIHSPSSLNLADDEMGEQGLGGSQGWRLLSGAIL